jgi:hypothetical protein
MVTGAIKSLRKGTKRFRRGCLHQNKCQHENSLLRFGNKVPGISQSWRD